MPKFFIPLIYSGIFATILVASVPKAEIRRLGIYGIIFGAVFDVFAIIFGNVTGLYGYINYGPFGLMGLHFFAPISWAIFFMLYFYFLPKSKPLIYIYAATTIGYCILFGNLITNLGIFKLSHRWLPGLIAFSIWISTATWGYYRLTSNFQGQQQEKNKPLRLKLFPLPARKIEKGKREQD